MGVTADVKGTKRQPPGGKGRQQEWTAELGPQSAGLIRIMASTITEEQGALRRLTSLCDRTQKQLAFQNGREAPGGEQSPEKTGLQPSVSLKGKPTIDHQRQEDKNAAHRGLVVSSPWQRPQNIAVLSRRDHCRTQRQYESRGLRAAGLVNRKTQTIQFTGHAALFRTRASVCNW